MLGSKDEQAPWRGRVRETDMGTCANLVGALLGLFTGRVSAGRPRMPSMPQSESHHGT